MPLGRLNTWPDPSRFDEAEKKLANMYVENFKKYIKEGEVDYSKFGPKV